MSSHNKRKRSASVYSSSSAAAAFPSDAINPLSHSQSTIKQLRLAGLRESDLLPSTYIANFPHRPILAAHHNGSNGRGRRRSSAQDNEYDYDSELPRRRRRHSNGNTSFSDDDDDEEDEEGGGNTSTATATTSKFARAKADEAKTRRARAMRDKQETQLGILTQIILRALEEGDIPRAKRAFGLLRRSTVAGSKEVDLRRNGLWSLGAEVLMRDGETKWRSVGSTATGGGGGGDDDAAVGDDESSASSVKDEGKEQHAKSVDEARNAQTTATTSTNTNNKNKHEVPPQRKRWGSATNMPQLRTYLEGLIRQYPYNRLHPDAISDLDFYPVLFGCEFYNVWIEHKFALDNLIQDSDTWSNLSADGDDDGGGGILLRDADDPYSFNNGDDDNSNDALITPLDRRLYREKSQLCHRAEAAMRVVETKMDTLLERAPYNRSIEMLRLRGMVALYMADLRAAPLLLRPDGQGSTEQQQHVKTIKETEYEKAKQLFVRMKENGAPADPFVERWLNASRGDGDDDDDYGPDDDDDVDAGWGHLPTFSSLPLK